MSIKPYDASTIGFIAFAEQFVSNGLLFGANAPFRRVLSLMRTAKCQTVVVDSCTWSEDCINTCTDTRFNSCNAYIGNLQYYALNFVVKKCHKFYFFRSPFDNFDINKQTNDDFLGYCIVHLDHLESGVNTYERSYLTEACIAHPFSSDSFGNDQGFTLGKYVATSPPINGKSFQLLSNYFSQQNGITNCCAHAAIKMAIKSMCPNICCEAINQRLSIDHRSRKANEGLSAKEICDALEAESGLQAQLITSSTFPGVSDLQRLAYCCIESRLPVILLLSLPSNRQGCDGHAISIIGHTFNANNWWSYSLRAYYKSHKHLSSLYWANGYIIQDDNFGPYYLITPDFLSDFVGRSNILSVLEDMMSSNPVPLKPQWVDTPCALIFVTPPEMSFIGKSLKVEPNVVAKLHQIVTYLEQNGLVPTDVCFGTYFKPYFELASIILRTFLIKKQEYLEFLQKNDLLSGSINDIDQWLPSSFWITEISIPELYWVNRAKVGEVITIPTANDEDGVCFVRLPGIAIYVEHTGDRELFIDKSFHQQVNHHPLIYAKGISI